MKQQIAQSNDRFHPLRITLQKAARSSRHLRIGDIATGPYSESKRAIAA